LKPFKEKTNEEHYRADAIHEEILAAKFFLVVDQLWKRMGIRVVLPQ
jgi:hypothetical protein